MGSQRLGRIQRQIQDEFTTLLVDRIRGALYLILAVYALFAVADVFLQRDRLVWLSALKAAGMSTVWAALHATRGRTADRTQASTGALGAVSVAYLITAVSGLLTHDSFTPAILCTAMTLITATLLPWGMGPQVASATVAVAAVLANVYGVTGSLQDLNAYPAVGALAVMGASVYVAYELERSRSAMAADAVDRSRAEDARREIEERYRGLVESATDAIYTHDLSGRLTSFNRAAERLTGYSRDEAMAMNIFQVVAPDLSAPVHARLSLVASGNRGALAEAEQTTHEGVIITKDGRRLLLEVSVQVMYRDGIPIGVQGIARDVTERRRTEEALALLASIVASSDDAIIGRTLEGIIVSWNAGAERLYGYSADDVIGRPISFLVPAERPDEVPLFLETIQRGEGIHHYETVRTRKDGQPIHVSMSVSPIKDRSGRVIGASSIARDITDRVRAEEALRQAHEELEKRVAERTAELVRSNAMLRREIAERERTEAALQNAKEAAEGADRAKGAFVATMSHEIRTPMNAVIGMTGLLLDTPLTRDQQEFVETIRGSGSALLTLINDILDVSKIGAGKVELENQPFDLRECIEESLDLVAQPAAEKSLVVAYVMDDEMPETFIGDVARLRQILVNLVGNAVKFTNRGKVVVHVAARAREAEERGAHAVGMPYTVHFTVEDTGIGIAPERMDRLFQAFSQIDASTTSGYGGTGLGLVISRRLAELMGGSMWVESRVGQGSSFHFTISVVAAAAEGSHGSCRGRQPALEGKRILIVEAEPTLRGIVVAQTAAWGMLPRATGSGEEALAWILRGDPFEIGLVGTQVADMEESVLAKRLRASRTGAPLPFVRALPLARRAGGRAQVPIAPEYLAVLSAPLRVSQLHAALVGIVSGELPAAVTARRTIDPELAARVPLRILVAEDTEVSQRVVLRILERMGYRADLAANGVEVLAALERQPYDVILMDVRMPEMDGFEAARQIALRWPPAERPWIIAMTAYAQQEDRDACLAAGMADYVSKPVEIAVLQAALERGGAARAAARGGNLLAPEASVDRAVFGRLREGQGADEVDLVTELIDIYLAQTPGRIAALQGAVAQRDAEMILEIAHRLKSSSAQLGATRLAAFAADLERKGRERVLEGVDELAAKLHAEFERVRRVLETERQPQVDDQASARH